MTQELKELSPSIRQRQIIQSWRDLSKEEKEMWKPDYTPKKDDDEMIMTDGEEEEEPETPRPAEEEEEEPGADEDPNFPFIQPTAEELKRMIDELKAQVDEGLVLQEEAQADIRDYQDLIKEIERGNKATKLYVKSVTPFTITAKLLNLKKGKLTEKEAFELEAKVEELFKPKVVDGEEVLPNVAEIREKIKKLTRDIMTRKFKGTFISSKAKLAKIKKLGKGPKGGADNAGDDDDPPFQEAPMPDLDFQVPNPIDDLPPPPNPPPQGDPPVSEEGGIGRGRGQSSWIAFVKYVQRELGCSYKEAMIEASKRRKN